MPRKNIARTIGAAFAVILAAGLVWAGPYEDAKVHFQHGDFRGSLALLQQAEQQNPNNPLVYAALGNVYRKLNDPADALQAFDQLLAVDPNLTSIPQKTAFARAYQSVGGDPSRVPGASAVAQPAAPQNAPETQAASTGGDSPQDLINSLATTGLYVAPGLQSQVDSNAIAQAIAAAQPRVVKMAVVGHTGNYPSRAALADDLRKRLNIPDDGVVLVATPKGISGSSATLSSAEIDSTLSKAGLDTAFAQGGLAAASVRAIDALSDGIGQKRRTGAETEGAVLFVVLAIVLAVVLIAASRKKQAMAAARRPIEQLRQQVIADFTYVDGYIDLLPAGAEAETAKQQRAAAYERYSTANGIYKVANSPQQLAQAAPLLQQAQAALAQCRSAIDRATGGTGVAMSVAAPPSDLTDEQRGRAYLAGDPLKPVEAISSAAERDRLQREIEAIPPGERGVSFFSGRPAPASELVPVSMVVGGRKRTVMATRDEAAAIARGERPQVRAFPDASGRYIPWYDYRGYDPYRDYYGGWGMGSSLGTLVDLYVMTELLGPGLWGGYGPWGYDGFGWGMPMPPIYAGYGDPGWYGGSYGGDGYSGDGFAGNAGGGDFFGGDGNIPVDPANSGGTDFFGQQDYTDPGVGFDTSTGDNSGGAFDFGGGGDSSGGGFDFGATDSGSSFDFGGSDGGGFDFGGGDSGGF